MAAGPRPSRSDALVRLGSWVGVTYLGFAMFGDIHLQLVGPTARINLGDFAVPVVGFAFGAVSGALVGVLQWLVLRSWAPAAQWWIPASMVGFGLAHALNDAFPYRPLDLIVILVIGGVLVSIPQAVALAPRAPQAMDVGAGCDRRVGRRVVRRRRGDPGDRPESARRAVPRRRQRGPGLRDHHRGRAPHTDRRGQVDTGSVPNSRRL